MALSDPTPPPTHTISLTRTPTQSDRVVCWFSKHWMLVFSLIYGLLMALPFLAPVLMHYGWETPARGIYFFYSFLCHQLPQRSFFFFGPQRMYALPVIQAAWQDTLNPMILRQFVGNPTMGWKVAWSDRMVSMYTSILLFGWIWWPLRKRIKMLPWWGFVLFLVPMALDGGTHFLSDFAGLGQGFRYTNAWLADLTNQALPLSFYAGDALGSFNSWMRLITGLLFGLGVVWFAFPILEESAQANIRLCKLKWQPVRVAQSGEKGSLPPQESG